ncbi:MAG: DEAD/DEAH box helicase [Spirochaeta sp.]|jgi:ATP-dependent RNA helicase RhlB|nr:DEAD/DEAH box helicase [Spirochaeta sp.]
MKFDELKLDNEILAGVAAAGFEDCTEVQARAIPHLIDGKDVMVQSQTGTGKTAAFLLPAFQLLLHNPDYKDATALIVAPTRELAVQIKEEADMLAENLPLTAEVFHGGVGYGQQEHALSNNVNIMVGTPGRILDLSQSGKLPLKSAKLMVIDEADRLFDMGFYPDIRKMMRRMRPREERLNMLFSATLSTRVRNIAWEYMNEPVEIEVEPEQITVEKVRQTLYHVSNQEKMSVMLGMLKARNPRSAIVSRTPNVPPKRLPNGWKSTATPRSSSSATCPNGSGRRLSAN